MSQNNHGDMQIADGVHGVWAWSVADAAALAALVPVALDIGKVAYQQDTGQEWTCTNNVGPVWLLTGGAVVGAPLTTDSVWLGVAGVAAEADFATIVAADATVAANTTHISSDGTDHANVVLNDTHRASDGTDHANVVLNDTHRASNGTDHANVVLNDTHRASDGKDHSDVVANTAAIALNTTHRGSDGKDHSDVVLNNTHRASDGTDHANVVLNDAHRASDGKDHSDVVLNNTHRASDGTDHANVVLNDAHRVATTNPHDTKLTQYMHKVTAGEVTNGYFSLSGTPVNASCVTIDVVTGPKQVNKQVVGATGVTPDFDVGVDGAANRVSINNNGAATGLSAAIVQDTVLICLYNV
jgi:hypothetical protein